MLVIYRTKATVFQLFRYLWQQAKVFIVFFFLSLFLSRLFYTTGRGYNPSVCFLGRTLVIDRSR